MDEVQRYGRFVRFKQALMGAQDYLLVGVDVAKAKHYACFMRSTGELLLKRFAFDNTRPALPPSSTASRTTSRRSSRARPSSEKWGQITLSCHPPLHADPFFWKFTLTPFFLEGRIW
jgi:hypothetical protein